MSTLVGPEVEAYLGTIETGTIDIHARDFQRWAAAVGDRNPLYFDLEFAQSHGHPGLVAPPLYLSRAINEVKDPSTLRPDGIPASMDQDMPLPERRMAGEDVWTFHHTLYAGETLNWKRELTGIQEKNGRSGPFVLLTWLTEYSRPNGELVASTKQSLIAMEVK